MAINSYIVRDWTATILDAANKLTNLQGMVTGIDLPDIERDYDTEKRVGLPGVVSFPMGWTDMESSVSFRNMTEGFLEAIQGTVDGELSLQLTGIAENSETGTVMSYLSLIRGSVMTLPMGSFSAQEVTEFELGIKVNYISRSLGASNFIYDPRNFIWSVNGVNRLEARKQILGV